MSRSVTRACALKSYFRLLLLGTLTVASIAYASPYAAAQSAPQGVRARIDLTSMIKNTTVVRAALVTPAMAENIGPGSHLIIDIPGAGTFGCTANFIWASGGTRYLGAAGHCFIPEGTTATHGPGADFDASGDVVSVCVSNCSFGGETGFTLTGNLVRLGTVAYARQTAADGDIGNDFGIVTIPASFASMVRPSMPVFGGPTGTDQVTVGQPVCHYGNGVIVGETFVTMARVGVGGGSTAKYWLGDLAAAPGDSGSAVVTCDPNADSGVQGRGAAGVLTHLGAEVGVPQHGFVFGTTVARAIEMATEAGIALARPAENTEKSSTTEAQRAQRRTEKPGWLWAFGVTAVATNRPKASVRLCELCGSVVQVFSVNSVSSSDRPFVRLTGLPAKVIIGPAK
jgi:hypothetical protein